MAEEDDLRNMWDNVDTLYTFWIPIHDVEAEGVWFDPLPGTPMPPPE